MSSWPSLVVGIPVQITGEGIGLFRPVFPERRVKVKEKSLKSHGGVSPKIVRKRNIFYIYGNKRDGTAWCGISPRSPRKLITKNFLCDMTEVNSRYAVGVDVGGSHVSSAVVDLEKGVIVDEPLTTPVDHTCSAEEMFSAWTKNLRELISSSGLPVRKIGMAFPGPFDYERGISHMEHKFVSIKELVVGDILQARLLDFPGLEFKYVNDAGAFALGESCYGAAKGVGKVLVLTLGTGLGSGFVENNRIIREGDTVPPGGEVWNLPWGEDIADSAFSTRRIVGRYAALSGKVVAGAKEVSMAFDTDPLAREVFTEFGADLAKFTAPLLEKFGAHDIILGGNISRNLDKFLPAMMRVYGQKGMDVHVQASSLLDKAAMLGAASLFA